MFRSGEDGGVGFGGVEEGEVGVWRRSGKPVDDGEEWGCVGAKGEGADRNMGFGGGAGGGWWHGWVEEVGWG